MGWNVVGVRCGTCIGVHLDGTEYLLVWGAQKGIGKTESRPGTLEEFMTGLFGIPFSFIYLFWVRHKCDGGILCLLGWDVNCQ